MSGTPLSVVLCSDSFFPVEGGAERQMRRVLIELIGHGVQPAVVARRGPGLADHEEVDGIEVRRVGPHPGGKAALAAYVGATARELRRRQPDVVVAMQAGSSALAAKVARAAGGPPYVVRLTGGSAAGSELNARSRATASRAVVGAILSGAAAVVAPARHLLDDLSAFGPAACARGQLVPNGVLPSSSSTDVRERSGVAWCGRDDPVKRLPDLIAVARRLPSVAFTVIGPAAVVDAPSNVRATGWVKDPSALLRHVSLLVSTSAFEGSSNACREALAAGARVVAYDVPGTAELVALSPSAVRTVPLGDVDALVAATSELLGDSGTTRPVDLPCMSEVAGTWYDLLVRAVRARVATPA